MRFAYWRPTVAHIRLIPVYALPEAAGAPYGQIRAICTNRGQPIGNSGLWLAAPAHAEGWVPVSDNEREFVSVPGLQAENRATPTLDSGSSPR